MNMAQSSEINIMEKSRVSLPHDFISPPTLPLTYWDLTWIPVPPVQSLHFYSYPHDKTHFTNTTLPQIKRSISLTLQHFYPLAGNLTWPIESVKPQISCGKNSGITLIVAESGLDFEDLVGSHYRDNSLFYPLCAEILPTASSPLEVPIMALQVTLFPNTGICIGITSLHVVGDGRTITHFIRSWASVCKSDLGNTSCLPPESLPSFDRSSITDPDNEEGFNLNYLKMQNITPQSFFKGSPPIPDEYKIRATFLLGGSEIQKLRESVFSRYDEIHKKYSMTEPKPKYLSSLVLASAYMWFCMVRLLASEDDGKEIEHLVIPVDYTALSNLPSTYFGNCLKPCVSDVMKSDMIWEDGLAIAAVTVANAIQKIKKGMFLKAEDAFATLMISIAKGRFLGVNGSPKLGFYEIDFGWGMAKKIEVVSVDNSEAMSVSERGDGEAGLEFRVVLNKVQMNTFASLFKNTLLQL